MMEVWTHTVDDTMVITYTDPTPEVITELRKNATNRPYFNNMVGRSVDIPFTVSGVEPNLTYTTIARSTWLDMQKAAQDARDAAAKAERIAARKAARQAAATALRDAKTANTLGLEPKSDAIIITSTVATTVNQIAAGGLTSEGEPA
jgi:hypothetical protein